nr:class I SAM-dependent methyltransferase [candidate division Zixibacteria bacterium]
MRNHNKFYGKPEYYDIAFDFRDIPAECDFLETICRKFSERPLSSMLELCAGPAYHSIEMARREKNVTALDISEDMVAYGLAKAKEAEVSFKYIPGDMTDFKLSESYDLVLLAMDSISYLPDNKAVYDNFKCVSHCLSDKGLYVIEIGHPRDFLGRDRASVPRWKMKRGYKEVEIQWGDESDPFDPITQITQTSVRLKYSDGLERGEIFDRAPQRCFTCNEFLALVDAVPYFEIMKMYGSMNGEIPFSNDKKSWRMIPILRLK